MHIYRLAGSRAHRLCRLHDGHDVVLLIVLHTCADEQATLKCCSGTPIAIDMTAHNNDIRS